MHNVRSSQPQAASAAQSVEQPACCTVCNSGETISVVDIEQIPVHCNILWSTREQAVSAPRGDMLLRFCTECGHLFNAAFDPAKMEYDEAYENSLHFSPRFQQYADSLVDGLVERHDLHGKTIVEVGCGQGDFLRQLCAAGENRGFGFDPAYIPEQDHAASDGRVEIVQDFYSEKYSNRSADFVCCRHTLEHIPTPVQMLQTVRRATTSETDGNKDAVVFFEVPNALYTVRDLGIWDLIYEHCSYFTPQSLAHAFSLAGFAVQSVEPTFGGQFLCIEALLADENVEAAAIAEERTAAIARLTEGVRQFGNAYRNKARHMSQTLARLQAGKKKVVVWGAGSKGVTFQNVLDTNAFIEYVVDVNPRKHGMYVAGTGQRIVSPAFLREYSPDAVVIMNPIYRDEIADSLRDLNVDAEIILA